jgi:ribonuclease HII
MSTSCQGLEGAGPRPHNAGVLVYAGIDEAGYGPMLGPLCLGLSVFLVRDHDPESGAPDLWKLLQRAVCRRRGDRRRRIAIEDSKKLKGANSATTVHPVKDLERGVLSFLAAAAPQLPRDDEGLFEILVGGGPREPWYRSRTPLPVAVDEAQLQISTARLRRALEESGVACAHLGGEAIDAGHFNRQVERMGSKAGVNLGAVLRLVDRVWRRWPDDHPRVIVDRQGGRTHYVDALRLAWPSAHLQILAESEKVSRYRIDVGGRLLTVSFLTEAESRHLPVALASMLAKYVRELHMIRLNRYFQGHLPDLKPTAGYVSDARRYLVQIEPLIRSLNLPRSALIRAS